MFSERRKNFRSPVVGSREATLIYGKTRLHVRLIDESAGGLKVTSESMPQFTEGSEVELESDDGDLYRMRVVHIEQRGLCIRSAWNGLRR
ncbi:MAG: PilZ domain-containing protein [Pirellulales bacterium]